MGALWGGCDDASGPVLVLVMTNGFRKSQSPPLGGAIPSAVSPEEADTLEHRERVEGTSLNDWPSFFFFFLSCNTDQSVFSSVYCASVSDYDSMRDSLAY